MQKSIVSIVKGNDPKKMEEEAFELTGGVKTSSDPN